MKIYEIARHLGRSSAEVAAAAEALGFGRMSPSSRLTDAQTVAVIAHFEAAETETPEKTPEKTPDERPVWPPKIYKYARVRARPIADVQAACAAVGIDGSDRHRLLDAAEIAALDAHFRR